jgi:hypothetical protein
MIGVGHDARCGEMRTKERKTFPEEAKRQYSDDVQEGGHKGTHLRRRHVCSKDCGHDNHMQNERDQSPLDRKVKS